MLGKEEGRLGKKGGAVLMASGMPESGGAARAQHTTITDRRKFDRMCVISRRFVVASMSRKVEANAPYGTGEPTPQQASSTG